jgi:hypothetical protein
MKILSSFVLCLALLPVAVLSEGLKHRVSVKYDGEERGKVLLPAIVNPTWAKECGDCHILYAPGLLPAQSWRKLMTDLPQHFDADASVTPQENKDISAFLVANASNRWTGNGVPLRITETQWFKSKHNAKEVPPSVWKRASVNSPGNCKACHAGAEQGEFDEDAIQIPH